MILTTLLLKSFSPSLQHRLHNLLSVVVFLSLQVLIITFQIAILPEFRFLSMSGLVIIGLTLISVVLSIFKNGISGAPELLFINGISLWTIFGTILTFLI